MTVDGVTVPASLVAPPRDPRSDTALPERDYAALQFTAAWYQVAQYQLEDAVFPNRSPTVASRCVRRLRMAGYIAVERWNRVGLNLIRVTARGRAALVDRGVSDDAIFVPEKPVAVKDLVHHLWIVDAGLMLRRLPVRIDATPCWGLRRRLAALRPAAIPDLLALRLGAEEATEAAIAIEIDLGGERLKNVFVPKLAVLRETLAGWASGQPAAVVILTIGPRRIAALRAAIEAQVHHVPAFVFALPAQPGRPGLALLRATLSAVVQADA
ncbi:MAG TPA: hypothetical protein VNA69_09910 [Thermoanaerobaculia bacterium]|nr:hypothetical protein [Thermoanaerobaculia bacterium]